MISIHKKGSITIETALAFTVLILFLAGFVSLLMFVRTDVLMQRAVSRTCKDYSLFTPLSVPLSDAVSLAADHLPLPEEQDGSTAEDIVWAAGTVAGIDDVTGNMFTEILMDGLFSRRMENTIMARYLEYEDGILEFAPGRIDVDYDLDRSSNVISVEVTYEVDTIIGKLSRKVCDIITVYGSFDPEFHSASEDSEEEDIWSRDNFTRGRYIDEQFGRDLPYSFPTIDSCDNGLAVSNESMDLTAPSFSDPSYTSRRMTELIDRLASFEGGSCVDNGQVVRVGGDEVDSRLLRVIIPGNSPDERVSVIEGMISYAAQNDVELEIVRYGESTKYQ